MCPVFCTLAALIAVLLIVAAFRPAAIAVTRSAAMSAPAAAIFPHINTLRNWDAWSPWKKLDPAATSVFEGPAEGVGACMRWAGNMQVGSGSMTITESRPAELVTFRMDFLKPLKSTQTAEFSFKPDGSNTVVTWTLAGHNNLMGKVVSLFINCEKIVGGQFDRGLASIREIVETKK